MENKPEENSLEDVLRWMDEDIDHAFERVLNPLEYGENEDASLIWQVVKDSERLLKQYSLQCAEMKEENERLGKMILEEPYQTIERLKAELLERDAIWLPAKDAEIESSQIEIKQLQEEVERLRKENTKTSALLDLASADARLCREEVERFRSENETLRAYRNTL